MRRIITIGDLNQRIKLQTRKLLTQFESGLEDIQAYVTIASPWACVETRRGSDTFDNIELGDTYTHVFHIRYRDNLPATIWIEYKNQRYDIVDVENLDERNEFLKICAKLSGDSDPDYEASMG